MTRALLQDLRFGLRLLRRSPGFALAAMVTLALGVGATTAVFSVANAVIFRPLQFPESSRLMTVLGVSENGAFPPFDSLYAQWRERQRSFELFAAALRSTRILRNGLEAREVPVAQVSADFLPLLGVSPALGRIFTSEEDRTGHDNVALLDDGFWRREFAANPAILGRIVTLNDRQFTVIGVLSPGVRFPGFGPREIWVPLAARTNARGGGTGGTLVIGRLRTGVSRAAAQADLDSVTERLRSEVTAFRAQGALISPLREWIANEVRSTLLMVAGAAGLLLLIGCANLANLLLARGAGRRREMAIRASLGAGRKRLAAQMFTESLLLAGIGGAFGIALATAAVRLVPAIEAIEIPRAEEIGLDRHFLLIGLAVSLASGVLFGLAPAFEAWRRDLVSGLHGGGNAARRSGGWSFRDVLVVAQVALVTVLLSGAGLMLNTMYRLLHVDLGFTRSNLFRVHPAYTPKLHDRAIGAQYLRDLADRVRQMPGVESVSVANNAPLANVFGGYVLRYTRDGMPVRLDALGRDVDPGYFRTTGIPLLAGRDFEPADSMRKPVPLILNRSAVRALFGNSEALGRVVECSDKRVGAMQVIGVVGDARVLGVATQPGPQAFAPLLGGWGFAHTVVARAAVDPASLAPAIRAAVRELDPGAPPPEITALDAVFADQVAKPRFYTSLLASFAILGLILAALGVYGVIAYSVATRTHEFGIRLAVGAQPEDIVRMVMASGARVIAAGAILGVAGAIAATRFLASLLFEVKPRDPATLIGTVLLLAAAALGACWFAARRAMAVDLSVALRRD